MHSKPQSEHFEDRYTGLCAQIMCQKYFLSQKNDKSVMVVKIHFRASDAFNSSLNDQKHLKNSPTHIKNYSRSISWKRNEIFMETFLLFHHFFTFSLRLNSVNFVQTNFVAVFSSLASLLIDYIQKYNKKLQ